jgi:hypothetical protein
MCPLRPIEGRNKNNTCVKEHCQWWIEGEKGKYGNKQLDGIPRYRGCCIRLMVEELINEK